MDIEMTGKRWQIGQTFAERDILKGHGWTVSWYRFDPKLPEAFSSLYVIEMRLLSSSGVAFRTASSIGGLSFLFA